MSQFDQQVKRDQLIGSLRNVRVVTAREAPGRPSFHGRLCGGRIGVPGLSAESSRTSGDVVVRSRGNDVPRTRAGLTPRVTSPGSLKDERSRGDDEEHSCAGEVPVTDSNMAMTAPRKYSTAPMAAASPISGIQMPTVRPTAAASSRPASTLTSPSGTPTVSKVGIVRSSRLSFKKPDEPIARARRTDTIVAAVNTAFPSFVEELEPSGAGERHHQAESRRIDGTSVCGQYLSCGSRKDPLGTSDRVFIGSGHPLRGGLFGTVRVVPCRLELTTRRGGRRVKRSS